MEKITLETVSQLIPHRKQVSHKNTFGHVLCIGGNDQMGGAILLSATAALFSGAGLVTVASHPNNQTALYSRAPECMFVNMYQLDSLKENIQKADVIVLGPGLGVDQKSKKIFKTVLNTIHKKQWLLIDADGLNILSDYFSEDKLTLNTSKVVLTPHLGEWKRLTNISPPADCVTCNQENVDLLHAIVILKKHRTEIYADGKIWKNTAGNPSMATGGMGDTLIGIVASFLAQFDNQTAAILSAVYIHSALADELAKTHYVTLPSQIIEKLPSYIKKIMK